MTSDEGVVQRRSPARFRMLPWYDNVSMHVRIATRIPTARRCGTMLQLGQSENAINVLGCSVQVSDVETGVTTVLLFLVQFIHCRWSALRFGQLS